MNEGQIRTWLLAKPKPSTVRVHLPDDDYRDMPCNGPWSRLAASIVALNPAMLEAYDDKGQLIRAKRVEIELPRSTDAPEIPPALAADPETARTTHFANLLLRAHMHTDEAFDKLLALVDRMEQRAATQDDRLERLERSYRKVQQDLIDQMYERAAAAAAESGEGDVGLAMLQALAGGAATARRTAPKKGNGAPE